MKGAAKQIAAFLTAAAMISTLGASVFAEFKDPMAEYLVFAEGGSASEDTAVIPSEDEEVKVTQEELGEASGEEYAASEDKTDTKKDASKPAEEITVYSFRTTAEVGDTFKIGYRLKPSSSDDSVTYSTTNSKIASVDSSGTVTALSKGTAVITVKASSGVKDRFSLTVKEPQTQETDSGDSAISDSTAQVGTEDTDSTNGKEGGSVKAAAIELKHSAVTLYEGDTYQIKYELTPKSSTDSVSYRSANKAIASVSADGTVTARGAGETRIICTAESGKYTKLAVTVLPVMSDDEQEELIESEIEKEYNADGVLVPSEVRFADESATVRVGETVDLNARIFPSGATYTYTIKSDNTAAAKVNSRGEVTGISPGNAIITLTTDNGKSDSIYVTVYDGMIKGIDVSKWNGDINWRRVKDSGMANFVMIRASYGYEDTDPMLEQNVAGCEKYDIPYGFYHYMYAKNVSEAKKEAAYFLNVIEDYSPKYPVVLDIEEDFYKQMSKKQVTEIVTTFMEAMENAGYYAMIYSYAKFFDDNLIIDKIEKYDIWVACWGDEDKLAENYSYHYGMWQYSETGRVPGIDEDVDLNYALKNYKATIEKYGLNIRK